MRFSLLVLVLAIALIMSLPETTQAQVTVVQDSCVSVGDEVRVYFTIINTSEDYSICAMDFAPDPQPPSSGCTITGCGAEPDWACWLNANGGAGFANPPYDNPFGCINYEGRGGYYITIQPGSCCWNVTYQDKMLHTVLVQQTCFTCGAVPTETDTWGAIKALYIE